MTVHETPRNHSPYRFHVELTLGEHSPLFLRKAARRYLRMWELPCLAEPVTLALTELLTNVYRHVPDAWCACTVLRTLHGVRIEVYDRSPQLPRPGVAEPLAVSGRGLGLVGMVTDAWGITPHRLGKTVWCEMEA